MIRIVGVLLTGILAVFLSAGTAWAHGGPIQLDVRGDGGQGVTATATYVRDGHAVSEQVKLTYTAVATDGKTVGPVEMVASAEGQSFYVSKEPLPVGDWTVTVAATHPSAATKTVSVTSADLPDPAASATPAPSGISTAVLVAIPVAVAVLGFVVVLALRRRKVAV